MKDAADAEAIRVRQFEMAGRDFKAVCDSYSNTARYSSDLQQIGRCIEALLAMARAAKALWRPDLCDYAKAAAKELGGA